MDIYHFIETLRKFGPLELSLFLFALVVIALLLKGTNKWARWHRKKFEKSIVSYKDPDNMPDLRKTLWKTRLQMIFAAIAILAFTFIAIMHSF